MPSVTSISSNLSLAKGKRTYVFNGMYNSIYDFPDIISIIVVLCEPEITQKSCFLLATNQSKGSDLGFLANANVFGKVQFVLDTRASHLLDATAMRAQQLSKYFGVLSIITFLID